MLNYTRMAFLLTCSQFCPGSNDVKLLEITLDHNLKFDKYASNIYLKANRKLSALTRVAKFLPFKERRILFKVFTKFLNIASSYSCFMEGKLMIR